MDSAQYLRFLLEQSDTVYEQMNPVRSEFGIGVAGAGELLPIISMILGSTAIPKLFQTIQTWFRTRPELRKSDHASIKFTIRSSDHSNLAPMEIELDLKNADPDLIDKTLKLIMNSPMLK